MEPETDLRYAVLAQSSDMWPWSPMPTPAHDDPINYNISTKIYPNPVYSQGSSSPSLPSNTPEPVDVSYYEASPSIPIDNMFFAESVFRHPEFEHPNVPLPTDEAAFNALLAEVVSPSTESFDDLVDWSGSSTSGGSPPLVENYLSPSPVTFPVLSADNSPSAILMSAPGGLAPATPLPPLQPSFPSTMPRNPTAPHTCPESGCGKSFYKRCELHKHIQKHSKPHRCSQCRTFCSAELRGLQRHYWASHREWAEQNKIPRQIAKCDFPGCKYEGRLDNLSRHMKRHTKDRDKRKKRR